MHDDTRKTLELFIEKARLLANGGFARYVRENGLGVRLEVNCVEREFKTALTGPEREALEALSNNIRYFLQNNEPISFQKLPAVYKDLSPNWVNQTTKLIQYLKTRLDANPLNLQVGGVSVTMDNIKEVFIYGDLAHSTKRERFKKWEENQAAFPILRFHFDCAVADIVETVLMIAFITDRELKGKHIPSSNSTLLWARLSREKKRSEWRAITMKPTQEHFELLKNQAGEAGAQPFEPHNEPQLSLN